MSSCWLLLAVVAIGGEARAQALPPTDSFGPVLKVPSDPGLPSAEPFLPELEVPTEALPAVAPFNVHLVISEQFFNRFVASEEVEPGKVDDFVFGAKVDGEQQTFRRVRLDLKDSPDKAHAAFVLEGKIETQTVGRTDQGAVQTVGHQEFLAIKDVYFDGDRLSTRHAQVFVRANNQAVAAWTRLDGTILQGLGQRLAISRAQQQRPQTEAYTRNRIADRVYPAFDRSIDEQLAAGNRWFVEEAPAMLRRYQLQPVAHRVVTTDCHLHYAGTLQTPSSDTPILRPQQSLDGGHAVMLYVHETVLNGLIDRLGLRGRKTTDDELESLVQRVRGTLGLADERGEAEPSTGPAIPGFPGGIRTDIEFDNYDPLRVRFQNNAMVVEIRATLKPAGQAFLPPLKISIPLQMVLREGTWHLTRGRIAIMATNDQILPAAAEDLIRQTLESDFPSIGVPSTLPIPNWPADQAPLRLSNLQAADGWLAISVD